MEDRILEHYLEELHTGIDIDPLEAASLFDALITSDNQLLLTRVLLAWNEKTWTEDELFVFASIMRERMKRINSQHEIFVDTVGTGGSRVKTFNVSTAAAFVTAGAGVAVAKHGNRAATSSSGSSDVLAELEIDVDVAPTVSEQNLNTHGLCFMFAPRFHLLSPTLAKARKAVGEPTIFNNLGPLCNPASAPHYVIGVYDKHLLESTARVLSRLRTKKSWVVYGESGLDEIALKGTTLVAEVNDGKMDVFEITAADFGVDATTNDLPSNCTAAESAKLIRSILDNKMQRSDAEKLVLINAAAAIFVTGEANKLTEAYKMAESTVRNSFALKKLVKIVGK